MNRRHAATLVCGAVLAGAAGAPQGAVAAEDKLPVLLIEKSPRAGALKLAARFGLKKTLGGQATLNFTSPNLGRLPLADAGDGGTGEDGGPARLRKFDPAKAAKLKAPPASETTERFDRTLKKLGLKPAFGRAKSRLTALSVHDTQGKPLGVFKPDRQVTYELGIGSIELTGAGAKIGATFDHDGDLAQLTYAMPEIKRGQKLERLSGQAADEIAKLVVAPCTRAQPQQLVLDRELVYYAHARASYPKAEVIYPSYVYKPTLNVDGAKQSMSAFVLPAVKTGFGATVQAVADGRHVKADATVTGGRAPLKYTWSSCSSTLPADDDASLEYDVAPRDAIAEGFKEEIVLTVTDADGQMTVAKTAVDVAPATASDAPASRRSRPMASASSVEQTDVGGSYIAGSQGLTHTKKDVLDFTNYMKSKGVPSAFVWGDYSVYESDFTDASVKAGGNDHNYVDNVDFYYYQGHGGPNGITVNTADGWATNNEMRLGNRDLEWAAFDACLNLKWEDGGKNVVQRWGQVFQGLHLLLGYSTVTYDTPDEGTLLGAYMMGFYTMGPRRIRDAWIQQAVDTQPNSVQVGWMAPIGPNGTSPADDYFHGKGAVSADIGAASITGWTVYYWWA